MTADTLITPARVDDILRRIFWTPARLRPALPFLAAIVVTAVFVRTRSIAFT